MFTLNQIKEAHTKVKSGADFPKYIQELVKLGVLSYDTYVSDGHSHFAGKENGQAEWEAKYSNLEIAPTANAEAFKQRLKIHQAGETNYPTFCKDAAENGVEKWTVDLVKMTCTYYDKAGNVLLVEQIPQV